MRADEVELRRETRQGTQYYQHQGAAEDELQPRATHRRYERLANNVHFLLGKARLLAIPARKF